MPGESRKVNLRAHFEIFRFALLQISLCVLNAAAQTPENLAGTRVGTDRYLSYES